jgi:hypothetical protein
MANQNGKYQVHGILQISSKSPSFNASFNMMKLDGSSKHKHIITATITFK